MVCYGRSYAEEIKRTSPDTTVKIKSKLLNGIPTFKRFYVCWGALEKGMIEGCRLVLFFDGCHLKSHSGGILLTAVRVDANNCIYPFAYAVVEKEKTKSWLWFIDLTKTDLNIQNTYAWTVTSDKQKGLIEAIDQILPGCEHRCCVMHLYKNFKASHKGLWMKNMMWAAARATRVVDFEKIMAGIREKDEKAFTWLAQRPATQWSKSHFSTFSKCDILLNNMSESFNSLILTARSKPIISMLEDIRTLLMKRLYVRRDKMDKFDGDICPKIAKILEFQKAKAMVYLPHWNGKDQFEFQGCYGKRFKVHIGEKTCSCRWWELSGIPCAHAICALWELGYNVEDYVDSCYSKTTFLKSYNHMMDTLNGSDMWPKVNQAPLQPPVIQRLPGRPKLHSRNKEIAEVRNKDKTRLGRKGVVMTCSICKKPDHNKRSCRLNKTRPQNEEGHEVPAANPERQSKLKERKRKTNSSQQSSLGLRMKLQPTKRPQVAIEIAPKNKGKQKVSDVLSQSSQNVPKAQHLNVVPQAALTKPTWKPTGSNITQGVRFTRLRKGASLKIGVGTGEDKLHTE